MSIQIILKDFFSLINIIIIVYLLSGNRVKNIIIDRNWYSVVLCVCGVLFIRLVENSTSIHIVYNYITIVISVMALGHVVYGYDVKYGILLGHIFLSIVILGQLTSCILMYPYAGKVTLDQLPGKYQIYMLLIAEAIILIGSTIIKKIVQRIPLSLKGLNFITIIIPFFLNIVVLGVCSDQLYYNKTMIIGNIWSFVTILAVCVIMLLGTICNIAVLENYLNVKKIESEKKLQISEMSLQYDYYVKQVKDMENIRRLAHDIKNHLEALRGNVDEEQKIQYINGIEHKLGQYQSYFKTGNTFIDNLLHVKKLEALDKNIEFKVFADFIPFKVVKNEDLCVIVSNIVDNALRECELMKKDNPSAECLIQLKAQKIKGFLSIICENSLREAQIDYLKGKSTLDTTKRDKKNHGIGMKNIMSVVQDYGGEISLNVVDSVFCISIIIPLEM